jgi:hypothetical protein
MRLVVAETTLATVASLLLLVSPCAADPTQHPKDPPADPSNIVGYRYDKNWWELGANIDDADLKGFRPEQTDDPDVEVDGDSDRTIWFGRGAVKACVTLAYRKGVLALITIRTRDDGENISYYKDYYAHRLGKCVRTEKTADRNSWLDKDGDSITVHKQPYWLGCPSVPPETVVIYLRKHVIQPDPAGNLPEWVDNLIWGLGYAGSDL